MWRFVRTSSWVLKCKSSLDTQIYVQIDFEVRFCRVNTYSGTIGVLEKSILVDNFRRNCVFFIFFFCWAILYVNFREERRVCKVVKCSQIRLLYDFFRTNLQKKMKKKKMAKMWPNMEQNACIFTYKMNLGAFLFEKNQCRRLPAYKFHVFYASKLTWLGHVFLRKAIFCQPYGAGGCRLIACACFHV